MCIIWTPLITSFNGYGEQVARFSRPCSSFHMLHDSIQLHVTSTSASGEVRSIWSFTSSLSCPPATCFHDVSQHVWKLNKSMTYITFPINSVSHRRSLMPRGWKPVEIIYSLISVISAGCLTCWWTKSVVFNDIHFKMTTVASSKLNVCLVDALIIT